VRPAPELPLGLAGSLSASQREAVLADDPVVCVVAAAGSGKTTVLTIRVARRSADGSARPDRTLVCTFSRKAADELRVRLRQLGVSGVTIGTIHRVALQTLADWRERHHLPPPSVLGDRRPLLDELVSSRPSPPISAARLESEIGWAKAKMLAPHDYEAAAREAHRQFGVALGLVAELYAAYERARQRRSLLDLDDLLVQAALALEDDDVFAEGVRWRWRHVLVDEMQDVNPAQFRLLRALVGSEPDLFVVGDPNQAIYGWNGADPGLLDAFGAQFLGARVIRLDQNRRSTPAIVQVAAALLGQPPETVRCSRPDGPLPTLSAHDTDEDEARWVAHQAWLAHEPGRRWSQMAVLARTNAQLETVAQALEAWRIPFWRTGPELAPASDLGPSGVGERPSNRPPPHGPGGAPNDDGMVLSTFHRAKGLQWPSVFVIGLREGLVPIRSARTDAALQEERRLLYVAVTRAESRLWCSWAARPQGGAPEPASRWVADIERALADLASERAPVATQRATSHLARLRALISDDRPG
jgi:DNA helicase-2/ATP-dependent DNA helicase PcrA